MRHRDQNGKLVLITCDCNDNGGCDEAIEPNPKIAESGWAYRGQQDKPATPFSAGTVFIWDYCPKHSYLAGPLDASEIK